MGVRMGVPEGKHAVEASDEARVAVMSCGLNRAGGGRPSFRATRASVRKISPLVRRAGYGKFGSPGRRKSAPPCSCQFVLQSPSSCSSFTEPTSK